MIDAIRAEWTKLKTLGTTWWLVLSAIVLTAAASAAIAAATHIAPGAAGEHDPTKLALTGIAIGQAVIVVLAVLGVSEEYGTGMIRLSLAATPRRAAMLAAKALSVVALTVIAAAPAVTACLIAGRVLLPRAGLDPAHGAALISLADGPTLRAALGSIVYLGLVAVLALGIATVVRDTAASTATTLGLLYLPPLLAQLVSGPWQRHIQQIAPMTAGLAIEATRNLRTLALPPWTGLGVLALWAAGALVAGAVALTARDA